MPIKDGAEPLFTDDPPPKAIHTSLSYTLCLRLRDTLRGMGAVNYYPVIFRAVSRLPSNTRKDRRELYAQARKALTVNTGSKREHDALEWAIRAVEKSPNEIPGTRASTASLVVSIFFLKVLWISDPTSMSAYWVVRPWNKLLLPEK